MDDSVRTPLYVVGAGGFGREIAFLVEDIERAATSRQWDMQGFLDARWSELGSTCGAYPLLGDLDVILRGGGQRAAAVGVGWPRGREAVYRRLAGVTGVSLPTLIHPTVVYDQDGVEFGEGTLVTAGCILTTAVRVGVCTALNLACTVGHDVSIGDFCVLNPQVAVSGGVTIEDGCLVGTGAVILQNLHIGAGAIVGAGAVVTRDVPPGATVVGVPAASISRRTTQVEEDVG